MTALMATRLTLRSFKHEKRKVFIDTQKHNPTMRKIIASNTQTRPFTAHPPGIMIKKSRFVVIVVLLFSVLFCLFVLFLLFVWFVFVFVCCCCCFSTGTQRKQC